MKRWFSNLAERFFADPPWAVCPTESFAERFAEFERRLRAAYPAEQGFKIRASRKKDSWVVYARKGLCSGFAVACVPLYEGESFSPTRVSVSVGTYSRALHLGLYALVAVLFSSAVVPLVKLLGPRLFPDPFVLMFLFPWYFVAVAGLFLLIATLLGAGERFWWREAHLDEVRALARAVLAADDRVPLPERTRAQRFQRVVQGLLVGVGLVTLAVACWALWEWWSYWDDPVNMEMARNGLPLETLQKHRTVYLVFGVVLLLVPVILLWGYALSRQRPTAKPPSQPARASGSASRESEVNSSSGGRGS